VFVCVRERERERVLDNDVCHVMFVHVQTSLRQEGARLDNCDIDMQIVGICLCADTTVRQEGGLQDIAIEVLHLLLTHLIRAKDNLGIGTDQKEAFLQTLRKGTNKVAYCCHV
jgi:hypothetical protein